MRYLLILPIIVFFFVISLPTPATSKKTGAEAARTGAPGNGTCGISGCHSSSEVNSGTGSIAITPPAAIIAGDTVAYTIKVSQSGAQIFGFQATMRKASDNRVVGKFVLSEGQEFSDALGDYITHENAIVTNDENEWTLRWVAPAEDEGDIIMYAAGVAGNNNNNRMGDHVYTTSATTPMQVSNEVADRPAAFSIESAFPNPFTSHAMISYVLENPGEVTFILYDMLGRVVQSQELGYQPAGPGSLDLSGETLTPGAYMFEISTPEHRASQLITLSR